MVGICIERVYICEPFMGNSTPDHESAHEHELVTDDDLLEDGASSPAAAADAVVFEPPQAVRSEDRRSRHSVLPAGLSAGLSAGLPAGLPAGLQAGEVLAGKYRVERVHAAGALGVSCDAEHLQLRQRVVIKLCGTGTEPDSEGAARFLQSARLAAQLRSAHLVRVLDLGTLISGVAYSVTEHLSGTDLRGVLRVREWLPVPEAVDYVLQVCEGLAAAHVSGLVHRNLKPANVFLARENDGRPIIKVLDFCLVDGPLSNAPIQGSASESLVSSLAYLAPEQIRDPSSVDVRADIWAIGALLHELLTGSPVYSASSVPGIFAAIAADSATPMSQLRGDIPSELEEVVLRCLEKEKDYRWSDVGALAKQLRRFASEAGRAAVDRVIMVLEGRVRSPRSLLPPALTNAEAARPAARAPSSASTIAQPSNRRLLEVGLAALAIMGCSVGIAAFVTIHNLQTILAARSVSARPVVASLSPALAAAPAATPAQPVPVAAPQPAAAPVATPTPTPRVWNKPAARPQVEAPAASPATVAPQPPVVAEPTKSTQALFDSAN